MVRLPVESCLRTSKASVSILPAQEASQTVVHLALHEAIFTLYVQTLSLSTWVFQLYCKLYQTSVCVSCPNICENKSRADKPKSFCFLQNKVLKNYKKKIKNQKV